MQRNYWYSNARTTSQLEDPEAIGHEAARRTLRRLGARRVPTQQAPVVFSPEIARSIIGNIFDAANGDAIYRHATFFADMLGEQVAGENITVIDDGTLVFDHEGGISTGGFGTSPFDGEGLPTRRTVLVESGILKNYVMNTYTARKLDMQSTGNASRGLAGNPGIGAGNFFLEPGTLTPEQIIGDVKSGLYVTETMGFGVNLVTGDYSQGASGLWIENGETRLPRRRDHHRRQPQRHVPQHRRHRQRPRLPRSQRRPHPPHRRHDHRRLVADYNILRRFSRRTHGFYIFPRCAPSMAQISHDLSSSRLSMRML